MSDVLVLLPLALATVLIASGILKLRDFKGTRRSLDDLPLPNIVRADWFARLFPIVEIMLGGALLISPTPPYPMVAALTSVIFLAYLVIIAIATTRPRPIVCNCFGSLSTAPVSRRTVLRNTLLLSVAIAAFVTSNTTGSVLAAVRGFSNSSLCWFLATIAIAAVIAGITLPTVARTANHPAQIAEPGVNAHESVASEVLGTELVDWNGNARRVASLAQEKAVLLVLAKTQCHACSLVTDAIEAWAAELEPEIQILIATSTARTEFLAAYPRFNARTLWGYRSLISAAGIRGVPAAIFISHGSADFRGPFYGIDEISRFVSALR